MAKEKNQELRKTFKVTTAPEDGSVDNDGNPLVRIFLARGETEAEALADVNAQNYNISQQYDSPLYVVNDVEELDS